MITALPANPLPADVAPRPGWPPMAGRSECRRTSSPCLPELVHPRAAGRRRRRDHWSRPNREQQRKDPQCTPFTSSSKASGTRRDQVTSSRWLTALHSIRRLAFGRSAKQLKFLRVFMTTPEVVELETMGLEQREAASLNDIALFRGGRCLAVVRHGPGGVLEVHTFANDPEAN